MHDVTAVIVAGGQGTRMGKGINKQYLNLLDRPVLAHTIGVFEEAYLIKDIVVVAAPGEAELCIEKVITPFNFEKVAAVAVGGCERQDSVWNGLKAACDCDSNYVAVHDGARPLLTSGVLHDVVSAAFFYEAAAAAVPAKDTVKIADGEGFVCETPDRDRVWVVQTPQVFKKEILLQAYKYACDNSIKVTDDASIAERFGCRVKLVCSDYENIKITTPEDLVIAEEILKRRKR